MLKEEKNPNLQNNAPEEQELALDDARRVKVLSPSMMVFKRFIRNKLAIVGTVIIVSMFLFSFIGPFFSPYKIDQKFMHDVEEPASYATAVFNTQLRFTSADGKPLSSKIRTAVTKLLADQKKNGTYDLIAGQEFACTVDDENYIVRVLNPDSKAPSFALLTLQEVATSKLSMVNEYDESVVDKELKQAMEQFLKDGGEETSFAFEGKTIIVERAKLSSTFYMCSDEPLAFASFNIYSPLLGQIASLQSDAAYLDAVNTAVTEKQDSFSYNGANYKLTYGADATIVSNVAGGTELFSVTRDYRSLDLTIVEGEGDAAAEKTVSFLTLVDDKDAFYALVEETVAAKGIEFTFADEAYTVSYDDEDPTVVNANGEPCLIVSNSFDPIESKYDKLVNNLAFRVEAETAMANGKKSFVYDNEQFRIKSNDFGSVILSPAGDEIVLVSDIAYGAEEVGTELTVDFLLNLQEAMRSGAKSFTFVDQYGEEIEGRISITNSIYYISTNQTTTLLLMKAPPSLEHPLGTDINGMDVFTRLMHGGRISLLVGFIVVFFETFIGVIVGGISGYFGKWVDTLLMRFVDLFNAIPFYPIVIILGSLMDELRMGGWPRILLLMVVIGILGWTGIARIVRGQILSLREQDFMVATEATGIRTSRRIFRHLVPNVMPLLIVNATMGLGGVILTEATLGFLGLGVKYPMASWGSIVNQATDMQVMTTAWWIWIPAGLLILLTVLGFNFVGDGLRDAFDPRMKR